MREKFCRLEMDETCLSTIFEITYYECLSTFEISWTFSMKKRVDNIREVHDRRIYKLENNDRRKAPTTSR